MQLIQLNCHVTDSESTITALIDLEHIIIHSLVGERISSMDSNCFFSFYTDIGKCTYLVDAYEDIIRCIDEQVGTPIIYVN